MYSASRLASRELPDVDVSLRGAVSIARRLQDPLAELVKIEPRSIGVGQYQHDVNQAHLARALGGIVEDCVNAVGADVNTASAALLGRVSGLNRRLADVVVAFRNTAGPFRERRELLNVPGFGEKTFEQAAGFLRIRDGLNPLDASGVHPEAYPVVERVCEMTGRSSPSSSARWSCCGGSRPPSSRTSGSASRRSGTSSPRSRSRAGTRGPEFRTACFAEGVEDSSTCSPAWCSKGS